MQLVIEISEEAYRRVVTEPFLPDMIWVTDIRKAIRKGTPLLQEHGRLIDADAFAEYIKTAIKECRYNELFVDKLQEGLLTVGDVLDAVVSELDGSALLGFKNTPTVIPAEVEE